MEENLLQNLKDAQPVLQGFLGDSKPVCGVILGSGLGSYAATLHNARTLSFSDVPHMQPSSAKGHVGRFILGDTTDGTCVLCMQGRLHGYEGYSSQEVAFPVWLMHQCGIGILVVSNAAGAINPRFSVGQFCLVVDHINFTGSNPLIGLEPDRLANRFVAMNNAYDPDLRAKMQLVALKQQVALREGVYLGLRGPSLETPAEIRAFGVMGADTVAMSMVEEVIAARHVGMRVVGLSLVTNMAAGIEGAIPNDEEVLEVGLDRMKDFARLVNGFLAAL